MTTLGAEIDRLVALVAARRNASLDESYTARLLAGGVARCARKFGEEAVETIVAATAGRPPEIAAEAADALYHLVVLLEAAGVAGGDVAEALARRAGQSGLAEKAARAPGPSMDGAC